MAKRSLSYQIVRPDKLLHEGEATYVNLVTRSGELGVYPRHAPEICALGDGVMRIEHEPDENGYIEHRIVISGGYAEITGTQVIVLAQHARDVNDIDEAVVEATRAEAVANRDALPVSDSRRGYFEDKIAWCDLLLKERSV
jgi:F-type H+-transporting ATPase subunit epsilon